jgi:hypothetical protein
MQTLAFTGQPDENFKSHSFSASSFTGINAVTVGVRYFIGDKQIHGCRAPGALQPL